MHHMHILLHKSLECKRGNYEKTKKGFTLVEILIALALIGILVAVVSPNLARIRPDQKKALFVKAYTTTESAVDNRISSSKHDK